MPSLCLTGLPRTGKSTVISRTVAQLRKAYPDLIVRGFYTAEVTAPNSNARIGFDVVAMDGERSVLARKSTYWHRDAAALSSAPKVGQYYVDVAEFERVAIPAIRDDDSGNDASRKSLVVIDEIGKMEGFSPTFLSLASEVILGQNRPFVFVLGSVTLRRGVLPLADQIRCAGGFDDGGRAVQGVHVWELTKENRGSMVARIVAQVKTALALQ